MNYFNYFSTVSMYFGTNSSMNLALAGAKSLGFKMTVFPAAMAAAKGNNES